MAEISETQPVGAGLAKMFPGGNDREINPNHPENQEPHSVAVDGDIGGAFPLDAIKIGRRHRQDHGDIDALARNIEAIGLLHPIVIRPDGRLIAGERRLRAFKQLGHATIPVTVIDLEKVVLGEYAENMFRKSFTPSEMVEIADAMEPIERAAARDRQAKPASGKFPEGKGSALDKIAKAVGKDRRTLESLEFSHAGLRFTLCAGFYRDGRIAEIFLSSHKPGSGAESSRSLSATGWGCRVKGISVLKSAFCKKGN